MKVFVLHKRRCTPSATMYTVYLLLNHYILSSCIHGWWCQDGCICSPQTTKPQGMKGKAVTSWSARVVSQQHDEDESLCDSLKNTKYTEIMLQAANCSSFPVWSNKYFYCDVRQRVWVLLTEVITVINAVWQYGRADTSDCVSQSPNKFYS